MDASANLSAQSTLRRMMFVAASGLKGAALMALAGGGFATGMAVIDSQRPPPAALLTQTLYCMDFGLIVGVICGLLGPGASTTRHMLAGAATGASLLLVLLWGAYDTSDWTKGPQTLWVVVVIASFAGLLVVLPGSLLGSYIGWFVSSVPRNRFVALAWAFIAFLALGLIAQTNRSKSAPPPTSVKSSATERLP